LGVGLDMDMGMKVNAIVRAVKMVADGIKLEI
jgi:hypothetical protein